MVQTLAILAMDETGAGAVSAVIQMQAGLQILVAEIRIGVMNANHLQTETAAQPSPTR
jgi:hypothetical protein